MRAIFTFLAALLVCHTAADLPPVEHSEAYDEGAYGHRPSQRYYSAALSSPRFNLLINRALHHDDLYTFLAPHGRKIGDPGPLIVDSLGTLVWTTTSYGKAFDFKVQDYRGRQYLTFWTGDDHVKGHGTGLYYMVCFACVNEPIPARVSRHVD